MPSEVPECTVDVEEVDRDVEIVFDSKSDETINPQSDDCYGKAPSLEEPSDETQQSKKPEKTFDLETELALIDCFSFTASLRNAGYDNEVSRVT